MSNDLLARIQKHCRRRWHSIRVIMREFFLSCRGHFSEKQIQNVSEVEYRDYIHEYFFLRLLIDTTYEIIRVSGKTYFK